MIRTDGGPTVVKSKLGWLLSGPTMTSDSPTIVGTHLTVCQRTMATTQLGSSIDSLTEIVRPFWETESVDVKEICSLESSSELFLSNVRFHDGRYEVGLPWLREKGEVPQHYNLCFNRLKHLQRRLIKDPNLLKEYQCLISEQLNLGIIEPVDDENSNTSYVHYLPHHLVIKQDRSTTKV